MAIDWASEHFVRLYTRETEDDLVLSWQARAVWCELLKKFDRNGFIKARHGAKTVAALIRYPVEVVEHALPDLLEDGRIVGQADGFLAPNYQDANYTPRAAPARKAYSRERSQIGRVPVADPRSVSSADNTMSRESAESHANGNSRDKMSIRSDQIRSEHAQGTRARARSGAGRSPIRPDWTPSEPLRALALELGLDPDVETQEFVAYWIGEGKPKADWDATFRARLVKRGEWAKRRKSQSTGETRKVDDL